MYADNAFFGALGSFFARFLDLTGFISFSFWNDEKRTKNYSKLTFCVLGPFEEIYPAQLHTFQRFRPVPVSSGTTTTCPPIFMQLTDQNNGEIATPAFLLAKKCNWLARSRIMNIRLEWFIFYFVAQGRERNFLCRNPVMKPNYLNPTLNKTHNHLFFLRFFFSNLLFLFSSFLLLFGCFFLWFLLITRFPRLILTVRRRYIACIPICTEQEILQQKPYWSRLFEAV